MDIEAEMKQLLPRLRHERDRRRARLPDVRDGLKPVHRRILFAMNDLGLAAERGLPQMRQDLRRTSRQLPSARRSVVYDALVRMAQDFNMRYPLVDGQGNFGSVDGDPPAAMRYTEARLARISEELLADLEKETVDFIPNFDQTARRAGRPADAQFRTCWSTAPAASPSAWPPTFRRTI